MYPMMSFVLAQLLVSMAGGVLLPLLKHDPSSVQGASPGNQARDKDIAAAQDQGAFLPAQSFEGARDGYEFGTGIFGTGYYTSDPELLALAQQGNEADEAVEG